MKLPDMGHPAGAFSMCDSCPHVSDPYGAPRDGGTTMHGGIDLATGGRTGIISLSLTDGEAIRIGATGFGPHSVTILSPNGTYLTYGHFASNLVNLGNSVGAGTRLGKIGTMGNSTGTHVHIQATTVAPFGSTQRFLGISFP